MRLLYGATSKHFASSGRRHSGGYSSGRGQGISRYYEFNNYNNPETIECRYCGQQMPVVSAGDVHQPEYQRVNRTYSCTNCGWWLAIEHEDEDDGGRYRISDRYAFGALKRYESFLTEEQLTHLADKLSEVDGALETDALLGEVRTVLEQDMTLQCQVNYIGKVGAVVLSKPMTPELRAIQEMFSKAIASWPIDDKKTDGGESDESDKTTEKASKAASRLRLIHLSREGAQFPLLVFDRDGKFLVKPVIVANGAVSDDDSVALILMTEHDWGDDASQEDFSSYVGESDFDESDEFSEKVLAKVSIKPQDGKLSEALELLGIRVLADGDDAGWKIAAR